VGGLNVKRGFVVCDVGHIRYVNRAFGTVSAAETGTLVGRRRGLSDAGSDIIQQPDSGASLQQQLHNFIFKNP